MKLSANLLPRPRFVWSRLALVVLLARARAEVGPPAACEPSPGVRVELNRAAAVVEHASDFDRLLAPLAALRSRYPRDLAVEERYQDAVQRYGIEGHLRKLTEEYQVLSIQHPDDLFYRFLYARSLMGRATPTVIAQMNGIIAEDSTFAPAHRVLAEIYGSRAFYDAEKQKRERERFLDLCPGSMVQQRPAPLPEPSPRVDEAERLLAANGDAKQIAAMAERGIRDDEWRLQHIRPFDWYSVDFKRQSQRELQARYWRLWSLQVRCYRRAGEAASAAKLLAWMDQRATVLAKDLDPAWWEVSARLVVLYAEGNQREAAARTLDAMQEFLAQHPNPVRTAELEQLRQGKGGQRQ